MMMDTDDLWIEYKDTADPALREKLILAYTPLVKYVASQMAVGLPQNVDQADLVSYGIFGLIDAIEKFDLDRGFKFETYAILRIKGGILDELRSIDWVPRSVRAKARALDRAASKLEGGLHRSPSESELAAELEIPIETLRALVGQISSSYVAALDEPMGSNSTSSDGGQTLGESIIDQYADPMGEMAAFEVETMRTALAQGVGSLPERERVVVALYYLEGLTLAEIGSILGVTESRVCQIHTKAVSGVGGRIAASRRTPALPE